MFNIQEIKDLHMTVIRDISRSLGVDIDFMNNIGG